MKYSAQLATQHLQLSMLHCLRVTLQMPVVVLSAEGNINCGFFTEKRTTQQKLVELNTDAYVRHMSVTALFIEPS